MKAWISGPQGCVHNLETLERFARINKIPFVPLRHELFFASYE